MRSLPVFLTLLCSLLVTTIFAQPQPILRPSSVPTLALPALDNALLLDEERALREPGRAPYFAQTRKVNVRPTTEGTWTDNADGTTTWRLRVSSPNALSINLGFTEYWMPAGGELYLHTGKEDNWEVLGPFTPADNETHNELWTPVFPGDELIVEVSLPAAERTNLRLWLTHVNHDFEGFGNSLEKSGSCNLDVVCGAADGWEIVDKYRDIIRATITVNVNGNRNCSGALVSNTQQDGKPYLLTAYHCEIRSGNAPSLVVFYNYDNSTCRQPNSTASGQSGNGSFGTFNTGAVLRAESDGSDMTLLELDDPINPAANAFLAGWDRIRTLPADTIIGIHHPNTDEKRISFTFQPTYYANGLSPAANPNGSYINVTDWDIGTTEPGSSGSPLFDRFSRIRGQLYGGAAACGNNAYDNYGSINASWEGGGTSSSRLRDWLDPNNTGATEIDGREANATALPVELIGFSGTAKECSYALSWSVAEEENFSHYEVEKSADGRYFTTLSRVESGRRDYTLTDESAKGQAYYRLKMVDLDGTYAYSSLLAAKTECGRNSLISLYPNPVGKSQTLQLDFAEPLTTATTFTVFSTDGRKLLDRAAAGTSGRTASLNIGVLPAGTYFLRVVSGGQAEVRSFVVM
ncbi:MAG: T9SS type A sorting domain-containing protein [Lewinella sp.]|nr:T9SS type A sorting domain-containing protein [Lewinella sp.]